jgi:hypothetical protein
MKNRVIALGLVLCISVGFVPVAALANEKRAKDTAIAATVVSAYLLSQRKSRNLGIAGAVGSAYLWKKANDSKKARHRRQLARQQSAYRRAAYRRAQAHYRYRHTAARSHARTAKVAHAR